jgi:hypothetical protein
MDEDKRKTNNVRRFKTGEKMSAWERKTNPIRGSDNEEENRLKLPNLPLTIIKN